jgi:hypothetical protein
LVAIAQKSREMSEWLLKALRKTSKQKTGVDSFKEKAERPTAVSLNQGLRDKADSKQGLLGVVQEL